MMTLSTRSPVSLAVVRLGAATFLGMALLVPFAPARAAADTQPAALLEQYSAQAGQPPSIERGRLFFRSRQGGTLSCASCHGATPVTAGEHASTGKRLEPLAPAANPRAFTDSARVEKWFRRNCQDVASRPCTPGEKADVLAWLMTLRP